MRISDWSSDVCSSDLRQRPMLTPFAGGGEKITGSMPRLTSSSSVRRSSRAASFKEVSTVWPSMMTCQLALRYCAKGDDNTAYLTESFDVSQSRTFPVTEIGRAHV